MTSSCGSLKCTARHHPGQHSCCWPRCSCSERPPARLLQTAADSCRLVITATDCCSAALHSHSHRHHRRRHRHSTAQNVGLGRASQTTPSVSPTCSPQIPMRRRRCALVSRFHLIGCTANFADLNSGVAAAEAAGGDPTKRAWSDDICRVGEDCTQGRCCAVPASCQNDVQHPDRTSRQRLTQRTNAVTAACCNEPADGCGADGQPSRCDRGCAAVKRP